MYVHLSKVLDQVDELIYQMEVLCERSPALIGHVCELLRRFQLHDQADRLVRKVGGVYKGSSHTATIVHAAFSFSIPVRPSH